MTRSHVRRRSRLFDEDETLRIKIELVIEPAVSLPPSLTHAPGMGGVVALARSHARSFLSSDRMPGEDVMYCAGPTGAPRPISSAWM